MSTFDLIGIYGGTFDPLHFGHLNLAIQLSEAHHLKEVWFSPAQVSPHKLNQLPIEMAHRLKMLQLALEDIPNFRVIDIEAKKATPSYTVDLLRDLNAMKIEKNLDYQFCLMLGVDSIPGFFHWKQPEEIVKQARLLIGSRPSLPVDIDETGRNPQVIQAIKSGLTKTHLMEISSTEIRTRIKNQLYVGHLVPSKVLDYIYRHQLYSRSGF